MREQEIVARIWVTGRRLYLHVSAKFNKNNIFFLSEPQSEINAFFDTYGMRK